ncbi:hypothetical protein [Bacterioplanoides sp.]|uniref:hypothetical protein n=1 Tax=Bacterioplanoides sp. TaxID=2066072 RepID=UPI003B00F219
MSNSRDEEYDLSDGQRLAILENTANTNRNILLVMALLALVGISVAITVVVLKFAEPEVVYAQQRDLDLLTKQVELLEKTTADWQANLTDINTVLDSSSASAFKAQLLSQEQSYQLHLTALKEGMRDLARMTPGSRTWLEIYNEKMDEALKQSKERQRQLERLQTNRVSGLAKPLSE